MRTGQPVDGQAATAESVAEVRVQSAISARLTKLPESTPGSPCRNLIGTPVFGSFPGRDTRSAGYIRRSLNTNGGAAAGLVGRAQCNIDRHLESDSNLRRRQQCKSTTGHFHRIQARNER